MCLKLKVSLRQNLFQTSFWLHFQVDIPDNNKVGTKRYLAPEILDESIDTNQVKKMLQCISTGAVLVSPQGLVIQIWMTWVLIHKTAPQR